MKVSLPYSRNRRYLTGMDWIIRTLNRTSQHATGRQNTFQVVLDVRGVFDPNQFKASMELFVREFPELGGRPSRDWTLAPYWKMPRCGDSVCVNIARSDVTEAELPRLLEEHVNAGFSDASTHLAFRVFQVAEDRHAVAALFDHQLFDASGAEAFLDFFHRWSSGEDCRARFDGLARTEPAHLSEWMRKLEAGKHIVRMLRGFAETTLAILPRPAVMKGRSIRFGVLEFDEHETAVIMGHANREAGFLMFMPYALASVLQALAPAFEGHGGKGRDYIVSVSVDLRTPDRMAATMFFNHLSFMFFRIPAEMIVDRQSMLSAIRSQMYDQVKNGFPRALYESSMLMRILPAGMLRWLMLKPLRGEFVSVGFAVAGKGNYTATRFMNAEVANLIHMPMVPTPPGIGFFVNHYGGKMNAVLSFMDGMLVDEDVARILEKTRSLL